MASDAITVIMNDHRVMERLFDQLLSGSHDRLAVLAEVGARLEAHSRAEEDHVYPAIVGEEPEEAKTVFHGYEEHHEAAAMLFALKQMDLDDPQFQSKLTEFVDAVKHHVEEEESEILPALRTAVDRGRLEQLGDDFERRRLSELAAYGIAEPAEPAGARAKASSRAKASTRAKTAGGAGVTELTRTELYEMAKAADIPGRSSMTKDELVKAVRKAKGSR